MKAAIAIDKWKRLVFIDHLTRSGFEYTEKPGITPDTLILAVETERADILYLVVKRANAECNEVKKTIH